VFYVDGGYSCLSREFYLKRGNFIIEGDCRFICVLNPSTRKERFTDKSQVRLICTLPFVSNKDIFEVLSSTISEREVALLLNVSLRIPSSQRLFSKEGRQLPSSQMSFSRISLVDYPWMNYQINPSPTNSTNTSPTCPSTNAGNIDT
jgi:hypothetical protein